MVRPIISLACGFSVTVLTLALPAMGNTGDETRRPPVPRGVYDKPFLARIGQGSGVGGYIDIELLADERGSTFDQHRFVPFLYGQVSDRVSVASEIEFEHGGFVAGDEETDGEIKIEFAHIDISAEEWLNLRAGVLLTPLGRFNLTHDSPVNDLTDRPLVDSQIIPTTLSESGMGIFGTLYPSEASVLSYEAYLVNGFNESLLEVDGSEARVHIREGRGSARRDNNNNRALAARLGFSPHLGFDFGGSIHRGRYTDLDHDSESLTIGALDGIMTVGPLELLGEYAMATIDIPEELAAPDQVKQNGYYAQLNFHFLQGVWAGLPNSKFTSVTRFDFFDLDTDDDGLHTERLALGVNFRPTEETAIKFDVNRTWRWRTDSWDEGDPDDSSRLDALRFSLASYF